MATKKKTRTAKRSTTTKRTKPTRRSIGGASYTVVAAPAAKTRTVTRKVMVPGKTKTRTVVKTVIRRAKSVAGSAIGGSKKEVLTNVAFLVGGYLGGMAIANLAPLPDAIKNSRFKGGVFLVAGLLLATKVKDKRFRMAAVGLGAYGGVTLAVDNIPQLSALRGVDALGRSRGEVIGAGKRSPVGASYKTAPNY